MKKLDTLSAQLKESAEWRGHSMIANGSTNTSRAFKCANCGMTAYADSNPTPNGIDIGGKAVALNCTSR